MKQSITKAQWNELTGEQKKEFLSSNIEIANSDYWLISHSDLHFKAAGVCIGEMIEFLGDNLNDWGVHYFDTTYTWGVYKGYSTDQEFISKEDELVDALFEAVKFKLNNEKDLQRIIEKADTTDYLVDRYLYFSTILLFTGVIISKLLGIN